MISCIYVYNTSVSKKRHFIESTDSIVLNFENTYYAECDEMSTNANIVYRNKKKSIETIKKYANDVFVCIAFLVHMSSTQNKQRTK